VLALAAVAGAQDSDDLTLHELAARGNTAGIARAVNAGVPVDDRDAEGRTALHVGAGAGHLFVVMMLVAKGADPNARDAHRRTPLHDAADGSPEHEGERYQIVKLLLAKGADPAARDAAGKRPVDYATRAEFKDALAVPPDVTSRPASRRPSRDSP